MYIISNERKVDKIIEHLRNKKLPPNNTKKQSALIIGEGSVTSMLPELSTLCDRIILADMNQPVIEHNQLMIELLLRSKNRAQFKSLYKKNAGEYTYYMLEEYERSGDWGQLGFKKLLTRAQDLGNEFFLSSEERFLHCKNAAEQLKIEPLNINAFDLEQVKQLKQKLIRNNSSISVINVTNLYEWDANINALNCKKGAEWQPNNNVANMLNLLLDSASEHIILYSAYEKKDDQLLVAKIHTTINDYLYEADQAVQAQILASDKSLQKSCDSRVSQSQSTLYGKRSFAIQTDALKKNNEISVAPLSKICISKK
ncbi:LIC_10091 family protein [Legionella drancourtii]|uniref:DUF7790 domain-containing protein n=1 Tax=Legionella drancourtii LLAP12 TaxID=658187 RepID=G9EK66_9GAMM|nr:hypothetical protein [Legionella drancourtii]EHL32217.1 hypothetical protein LDG_5589 [Legionella drancourtii LLAP12]